MGRVGRQQQHATVWIRASQPHGKRRRDGGLADAAFAGHQQQPRGAWQCRFRRRPPVAQAFAIVTRRRLEAARARRDQDRPRRHAQRHRAARPARTGPRACAQPPARDHLAADGGQRRGAARLLDVRRDNPDGASGPEAACQGCRDPPLLSSPGVAHRTAGAARQRAIDDQFRDRDPAPFDRRNRVLRFGQREPLRQRHPVKRRALPVAKDRRHLPRLRREPCDETIGRFRPVRLRETFADDPVLLLQIVKRPGQRQDRLGRCQQPERMSGRRRVDDDDVVWRRRFVTPCGAEAGCTRRRRLELDAAEACELQHAGELVDPGQRQIEQLLHLAAIQPGAVLDRIAERAAMLREPALERLACVQLDGLQTSRGARSPARGCAAGGKTGDRPRRVREPHGEGIAKGMRRVGGRDQHTGAASGFHDCARRRARRFADAALAAVEEKPG